MKANPFAQVIQAPQGASSAVEANDLVVIEDKPRGRGRPKKVQELKQTSTIFRLDEESHYKLKKLALHDDITLNELLLKCVREHCQKRGVEIS
jgi:hypothetical protein